MNSKTVKWYRALLVSMIAGTFGMPTPVYSQASSKTAETELAHDSSLSFPAFKPVDPAQPLIPQTLLSLVHAEEVQQELKLDVAAIDKLEQAFADIDGDWWRSRNLQFDQQRTTVAELESKMWTKLATIASPEAIVRLRQLELQSQSARMLLRPDVAEFLRLTDKQKMLLHERVNSVTTAANKLEELTGKHEPTEDSEKELATAKINEDRDMLDALSPEQVKKLGEMIGPIFETGSLARIYPMAPELIETDGWVGKSPGTLASLRGKVVLVHFYAFECINCRRNLPRYNEWVDQFRDENVVVIGIQTPETSAERDAAKIRAAAAAEKIEYPVLLDLQSKNWNEWSNTMWPTVYVIDRKGYLRMWWQGELNWEGATKDKQIAEFVKQLLNE